MPRLEPQRRGWTPPWRCRRHRPGHSSASGGSDHRTPASSPAPPACKGVLGDADAHRGVKAQRHRALLQSLQQLVAGDGRELHGQVVEAGAVHADTAADHHDVPALDVGAGGGAGAHPDEGIRPALMELLHADGGGGPPIPVEVTVTRSPSSRALQVVNSRFRVTMRGLSRWAAISSHRSGSPGTMA